ncbi:MAG: 30S ribosomal protein S20 [Rhabdochlamydiaceae bacterium]|jgi:small subunit ribosomal protein S20|nr:30S ribosomal protein S20 [Rhabdochlamydiaceae bacterium]
MAEEKKEAAKKKNGKISSAKKRDKQSAKKRLANRGFKATVRTAVRAYEESLAGSDKAAKQAELNKVYSLVDKGVKTGRFKVNQAARTKARLSARLK